MYEIAAEVAKEQGARMVLDIGCGGAFKLIKHFGHLKTCGMEVEPTVSWLRKTYPGRCWKTAGRPISHPYDMVICSDVIEHVEDPDALLGVIKSAIPKRIVISTPCRELIPGADPLGPPRNPSHIREWTFEEFGAYLSEHFEVLSHEVCTPEQFTQVAVCRMR